MNFIADYKKIIRQNLLTYISDCAIIYSVGVKPELFIYILISPVKALY